MMKKLLTFLSCLFLSVGVVVAQDITATGTVVDEAGMEVIGATVVLKGTSIGVATNVDGQFSIKVPEGSTLVFTMVGLSTVEKKAAVGMKVVMETATSVLDEVMVVAYGTAKKSSFTGSASVVKADAISDMQVSNPINALAGKVTGVQMHSASGQPGLSSPTIRIRGVSSIKSGNKPLIILDGAPFEGDLNAINNNDIESMTVLKDAASSALYGARGANGVIIITTKKGKDGRVQVVLDAKWGVNSKATQDYDVIKDPAQYYEMHYGALYNYAKNIYGYTDERAYQFANQNLIGSNTNSYGLAYNVFSVPNGQYMIGVNGKMNPNATLGNVVSYGGLEYLLTPDNWLDDVYKKSLRQEYNLSASTATDKSSFYMSANYLKNEGIIQNSGFERISGRLKADHQVLPWLKMGANMDYSHFRIKMMDTDLDGKSNSSGNIFAIANQVAPIYPLYVRDAAGNIMTNENGITMYDYADRMNAGLIRPYLSNSNAIGDSRLNTNGNKGNQVNSTFFAEARFLEDFKFTTMNSIGFLELMKTAVINPYYGQYATSNGIVSKKNTRIYAYNIQQLLEYTKNINNHHINALLGHEYNKRTITYLSASKSNMFDPNNHELDGAITDGSMGSYNSLYNVEGFLGRAQYDYDETYFGSFSYRRDGSSKFHPDHRWGSFWSMGGAWIISKHEKYNIPWLNFLKFKMSYGEQGNDQINDYLYTDTYNIINSLGSPAAVPKVKGNSEISWEKQGNFNTGVEFELFDGKLNGGLEYFYRKTSDMLSWFTLPASYGFTGYMDNVGDMRNTGIELELDVTPVKTNDLTWNISMNMTYVSNKITYIPEENKLMTVDGINGYSDGNKYYGEGKSIYTYYLKKFAGVDQNGESLFYYNVTDAKGVATGEIGTTTKYSDGSYYLCGTSLAPVYGGFGTSIDYKGFDFTLGFVYQIGGKVYDSDYATYMGVPDSNFRGFAYHADLLNAWTPENTSSSIPRFQYGDLYTTSASDRFLESASYLSLQNIVLGYTLPARVCKVAGIEKLRVYFTADNVWLWSKRQGLDPRQSNLGESTNSYYSAIRTLSGGITLTF